MSANGRDNFKGTIIKFFLLALMFPASAGMNRHTGRRTRPEINVPRKRGDEPIPTETGAQAKACSPQARG